MQYKVPFTTDLSLFHTIVIVIRSTHMRSTDCLFGLVFLRCLSWREKNPFDSFVFLHQIKASWREMFRFDDWTIGVPTYERNETRKYSKPNSHSERYVVYHPNKFASFATLKCVRCLCCVFCVTTRTKNIRNMFRRFKKALALPLLLLENNAERK